MKLLTELEVNSLAFKKRGLTEKAAHPQVKAVISAMQNMRVGESLMIAKSEWPLVSDVGSMLHSRFHSKGNKRFRTAQTLDNLSWVVRRYA